MNFKSGFLGLAGEDISTGCSSQVARSSGQICLAELSEGEMPPQQPACQASPA